MNTRLNLIGTINLAKADGGKRTFEMVAYSGGIANAGGGRVVIDLDGMDIGPQRKPILKQHDPNQIVGYSSEVKRDGGLVMTGVISSKTAAGKEVAELSDEGFPWQASVGIDIGRVQPLAADEEAEVNGAQFAGPGFIIRQSKLRESSFVPVGADGATSAVVFADGADIAALLQSGDLEMADKKSEAPAAITPDVFAAQNPQAVEAWKIEGANEAKAEFSKPATAGEMKAAFPGDTGFAIDQLGLNASLLQAKGAYADVLAGQVVKLKADLDAAKLRLSQAMGGHGQPLENKPTPEPKGKPGDDAAPKEKAEWEWENTPDVRKGFSSKANYLAVREAELSGQLRVSRR